MIICSCSFHGALAQGKELTLFAQKAGDNNGETAVIRREMGGAVLPVKIPWLIPGADR
jgi:hypothetical protein